MTHKTLSAAELSALQAFAAVHGRNWKQALRDAWMDASEPGILQALRNDRGFGPRGLNAFSLPEPIVTVKCDMADDCTEPIAYIDRKGYAYCDKHGRQRQQARKLSAAELHKLQRGETLKRY